MKNIIIVLAIGGYSFVRMSNTERESTSNIQDQETEEETTTPEETTEPEAEPEPTPETIDYQVNDDTITVTLPDLEVWGVIHIGS